MWPGLFLLHRLAARHSQEPGARRQETGDRGRGTGEVWRGTGPPPSLSLHSGQDGVKRRTLLPGDVVAAENESLQAGQAVHLSLVKERERGRDERKKRSDVRRRRRLM